MATRTLGTAATTSLRAFVVGTNDIFPADLAAINTGIRADQWSMGQFGVGNQSGSSLTPPQVGTVRPRVNQPYVKGGWLIIPNRGSIVLRNGDIVAWDDGQTGWPIVVSADAVIAGGATSRWVLT